MKTRANDGITLVETLVSVCLMAILAGIALPITQDAREEARRIQCAKQVGVHIQGSLEYQEAFNRMPPLTTGPGPVALSCDASDEFQNHQNTGAYSYILPFVGKQEIFDLIPSVATDPIVILPSGSFSSLKDLFTDPDYRAVFKMQLEEIICPSNADYLDAFVEFLTVWGPVQLTNTDNEFFFTIFSTGIDDSTGFSRTSYLPSMGGFKSPRISDARALDVSLDQASGPMRNRVTSITTDQLVDGASNTIGWSESLGFINAAEDTQSGKPELAGANFTFFNNSLTTGDAFILGNAQPSFLFGSAEGSRPFLIGSMHPEGNNVAMCDGSVRFINRNTSRQVMASLGCGGDGWILPRE